MRTWVVDQDRCEFAIWFGTFKSDSQLKQYALKDFLKELQITKSYDVETFYLGTSFAEEPGNLSQLIGKLSYSQSYDGAIQKAAKKHSIAKYNGAIALFDYFADEDVSKDAKRAKYFGSFKYNMLADSLESAKPAYLHDQRVSVWFGSFPSKEKFESYFNLPDYVPRKKNFKFKNPFAEDFQIPTYTDDFTSYNLSRSMKPKPFEELVSAIPMHKKLLKAMVKAAEDQKVSEGNAVYVAFRLDYDELKSGFKKPPRSRYDFHYVGAFDDPDMQKKKR